MYTRYFSGNREGFSGFYNVSKIDSVERIKGNTRRHLVIASALNYSGHHAPSYERITFTLIDTPENGIKIIKFRKKSNVDGNTNSENKIALVCLNSLEVIQFPHSNS